MFTPLVFVPVATTTVLLAVLVIALLRAPHRDGADARRWSRWFVLAGPLAGVAWLMILAGVIPRDRISAEAMGADSLGAQLAIITVASLFSIGLIGALSFVRSYLAAADALRESEERFRAVFDSASNGLVVLSAEGEGMFYNEAMLELLGFTREEAEAAEREQGRPFTVADFVAADDVLRFSELRTARLRGETEPSVVDVKLRRADGEWIDVELSVAVYSQGGLAVGVLAEVRDVTERLAHRQQQLQSQRLEAMGTLVAGVSHDFNNLLTTIGGGIDLARDDDHMSPWLERASVATARAGRLVKQLLQFSRQGEGESTAVDVYELAEESVGLVSETIDRRITIALAPADGTSVVWGDRGELQQVVMNLLVNARDAVTDRMRQERSPGYEPSIQVTIENEGVTGEHASAVIRVADNGTGIPGDVQERIFDPFFTTKDVDKGTGLGLSTAYGIVSDLGGTIAVDSSEGEGATFTVRLPARRQDSAVAASDDGSRDRDRTSGQGERILVVDDEPDLVDVSRQVLTRAGYDVTTAGNGADAIELMADQSFALVLLDVNMPAPNGWETLAELRATNPHQPVLMMSGNAIEEETQQSGATGLLHKPFDGPILVDAVQDALRIRVAG